MKHFYFKHLPILLLLVLLAGSSLPSWAQQIQGAELTYTLDPANPLKIRGQLTAYTDFSHTIPDNHEVHIHVGPDQWLQVERTRRSLLPDGYYKSVYLFDYVFPAPGTYPISFGWQNRDVGMVNFTDSGNQAFWITTQVVVDSEATANHQSPQFLTNPVQVVPLGQTVRQHMGAYEPEGDSLTFQLVSSLRGPNTTATGYTLPDFVQLNAWTGELTYTNPTVAGRYALAVKITEYRNKTPIGHVIRDFTIIVRQPAATFAPSLAVKPGAGISISPQNQILISPNQVLSLQVQLQDELADTTLLEIYSDLFAKTDKFQVVRNLSGKTRTIDLSLEADPALMRRAPYLVVLRAESRQGRDVYSRDKSYTQEIGFWVYIGSDIVEGVRAPDSDRVLRLFPNPAAEVLYLDLPYFRPGLQLQVYTAGGQLVWQQALLADRTPLLRRHFAAGKYFYRIVPMSGYEHQGTTFSGRFIFR